MERVLIDLSEIWCLFLLLLRQRMLYQNIRGQTTAAIFSISVPSLSTTNPPHMLQFRIATLFILIAWVGAICAGLTSPFLVWTRIVSGLTVLSVLTAVLLILYRCGSIRAMAVGYVTFSAGFLFDMYLWESVDWPYMPPWYEQASIALLLYKSMHSDSVNSSSPELYHFAKVFHQALATLIGLLGSLLAQYLYATQPHEKPTTTNL
jgi:hypothetical protein